MLAVALGLCYTWLGILLAANGTWPGSFFIAAISFVVYLPVRLFSHRLQDQRPAVAAQHV